MTRDIYLVLLEYGQQHESAALAILLPVLNRLFPAAPLYTVIVDNALASADRAIIDPQTIRLEGDNSLREFSGWDRGLKWLDQRFGPPPDSVIVLANDTVVRPEKRDRVCRTPAGRASAALGGALVGYVEAYPRPVDLFGSQIRQWVDTSFLVALQSTLAPLRPLARPIADDEVFSTDWWRLFCEPSPLSENYRAYLRTWLFGEQHDGEFPHTWHANAPLDESNFEEAKVKLRCLFCEHLLSAHARARRIPLVDIRERPLAIDPF